LFTFPNIASYRDAVNGANPFAYTQYTQWLSGSPVESLARFASVFVQDDWQYSAAVKIIYGLRYERYRTPDAHSDGNNWGPRGGLAWAWNDQTVLRASSSILFERPFLTIYDSSSRSGTLTIVDPATAGAPAFTTSPDAVATPSPAVPSRIRVGDEFETARTWHNHVQLERTITRDYAVSLGYVHARHANLPTVTDTNLINPAASLADGRGVFSPEVTSATRLDPRFNHVYSWQSTGAGTYNALTVGVARRYVRGLSMDVFYTLSRAVDAAPFADRLPAALPVSSQRGELRSDPAAIERDRGRAALDVRHGLAATIVYNPAFAVGEGVMSHVLNGNQFGAVVHAHSGAPYTLRAARDLNGDGIANDRPLFAERNAASLPARYNVDLRYSRHVAAGPLRGEVIGEFRNLFNRRQVAAVNAVVDVDSSGTVLGDNGAALAAGAPIAWYPARQFQLGFRLRF
jgi:hypothetical protein